MADTSRQVLIARCITPDLVHVYSTYDSFISTAIKSKHHVQNILYLRRVDTVLLFPVVCVLKAGMNVGLGGHQLSPFRIFGFKILRMRSFFVRSAGSSLFCKTCMRKKVTS